MSSLPPCINFYAEPRGSEIRPDLVLACQDIPGVKLTKKGDAIRAPVNAAWIVEGIFRQYQQPFRVWSPPTEVQRWPKTVDDLIVRGLRPIDPKSGESIEKFLTPYQTRESLKWMGSSGVLFRHPPGCLTGDAIIVVNRAGNSKRYTLRQLVHKFNGGKSYRKKREYEWDLSIPTMVQCRGDDGTLRLNRLVHAVYAGFKLTYTITTESGKTLRATGDHHFLVERAPGMLEWQKLCELSNGSRVIVNAGQQATTPKAPKRYYPEWHVGRHHPYATYKRRNRKFLPGTHGGKGFEEWWVYPKHRLTMEALLSGLSDAEFIRRVRAGEITGLTFLDPAKVHVHHKDENTRNFTRENLEVLEGAAHHRQHALAGGMQHVLYKSAPERVVAIEKHDAEETFDLMMADPLNNFVANDFVVHNSGKSLTGMLYALGAEGLCVVVTGAKGRLQWRDQIRRYTTHEPHLLLGTGFIGQVEVLVASGMEQIACREMRDRLESMIIACSCGAHHRFQLVRRPVGKGKGYDLIARVYLTPGHHDLGPTTGLPFDIVEPSIPESVKFIIVGWETLAYHIGPLSKLKIVTVILDEAHRAKSHKRAEMVPVSEQDLPREPDAVRLDDGRYVKFVKLANIAASTQTLCKKAKRKALLTATMVKDRIRDMWAQLDYAQPFEWGKYMDWARRYCDARPGQFGIDDRGASNQDELYRRMSFIDSYVSLQEYQASMPETRRETIYLSVDAQQHEDESFVKELAEAQVRHASVHSIANIRLAAACSRKRKALVETVVEEANAGAKVVVFIARHHDVDALKALFKKRLSKLVRFFGMDGRDSQEQRHDWAVEYVALASHAVLVATHQSMGEQVDLQETDIMHVAHLPFTITELVQTEGRCWRKGGNRAILNKYWIAEGSADEHVANILLDKLPAIEKMRQEGVAGMREALAGNQDDVIAGLAALIMQGTHDEITGIAGED